MVNMKEYGNVTKPLLIHELADERWKKTLDERQNIMTLNYKEGTRPSMVYGNNNATEFQ